MGISANASSNYLELTNEEGRFFEISVGENGLELRTDNGRPYEDNRCCSVEFSADDAPDALVAIQAWIEGLCDEH